MCCDFNTDKKQECEVFKPRGDAKGQEWDIHRVVHHKFTPHQHGCEVFLQCPGASDGILDCAVVPARSILETQESLGKTDTILTHNLSCFPVYSPCGFILHQQGHRAKGSPFSHRGGESMHPTGTCTQEICSSSSTGQIMTLIGREGMAAIMCVLYLVWAAAVAFLSLTPGWGWLPAAPPHAAASQNSSGFWISERQPLWMSATAQDSACTPGCCRHRSGSPHQRLEIKNKIDFMIKKRTKHLNTLKQTTIYVFMQLSCSMRLLKPATGYQRFY